MGKSHKTNTQSYVYVVQQAIYATSYVHTYERTHCPGWTHQTSTPRKTGIDHQTKKETWLLSRYNIFEQYK